MDFTKRQTEILDRAIELIGSGGIQGLTTKALAARIGFSEPALYRHFTDKNEILNSVLIYYQSLLKEGIEAVFNEQDNGLEHIIKLISFQFKKFEAHPSIIMVIFSEPSFQQESNLSNTVRESIINKEKQVVRMIQKGQKDGSIKKKLNADVTANIIMGSMRFTALRWKMENFSFDLNNSAKELQETIRTMIESSSSKKKSKIK